MIDTLSTKSDGVEVMFFFNICLPHLINKLSLICNKAYKSPESKCLNMIFLALFDKV